MSSKKREDLVIPYHHVPIKTKPEASAMIAQTLPMAAMFMRNKLLSWSSLFLAVQAYLNEPVYKVKSESSADQPPLLRIVFALVSLATCYIDLIIPSTSATAKKASNLASMVSETVSTIASSATE
ncbi:uncharacterized protein KQ657_005077 [Scheffersomyces spartinae]|uniref:Uncharacterized protein n=1 Tax=Scheffersomyces spartinae TaxID=45513 RepID=A0A9P7V9N5_9ASCO|nr:uncharacterized protein KQ657_005077 [Scheffersomyces spartinae]KAG7193879.1 hypothetical protein KQ657_005077 [Scheffersomyces spartinae]